MWFAISSINSTVIRSTKEMVSTKTISKQSSVVLPDHVIKTLTHKKYDYSTLSKKYWILRK